MANLWPSVAKATEASLFASLNPLLTASNGLICLDLGSSREGALLNFPSDPAGLQS